MRAAKAELVEFEIGRYVCPKTKALVPLKSARPLAFVEWPVTIKNCPDCGGEHLLQCEDLQHPPVFGYE